MRISVKCLVTSFMILALMAGAAFAGTARVNMGGAANTPYAISAETLGVARDVVLTSVGASNNWAASNVALSYELTQNMTTQNLLQVSLSNAAFNGAVLYVCSLNADLPGGGNVFRVGTGTPAAGATSFNFQAGAPVNAGSFVFLTSTACPDGPGAGAINANMPLRVPAFSSAGFGTATVGTVTAGNIQVDPTSTVNAVNIQREYAVVLTTRNMVIDYLNANLDGPGTGTTFVQGTSSNIRRTNGGANNVFAVNRTNTDFTVALAGLIPGFQTTTNTTTDWTGVTDVFLANGAINCAANLGAVSTSPSGAVVNTAPYPGAAANVYDLCMNVNGTTELTPRTIAGTYGVTVPGGNPAVAATGSFQVWALNAFQAYVPHMRWDTADNTRTFVRFVNRDTRAIDAQVAVQLTGVAPVTYSLGSIPARGIVTYSARTIAESNGITADNYAALFTVKTSQNNVHAEAFFNLVGFGTRNTTLYEIEGNKLYNMK